MVIKLFPVKHQIFYLEFETWKKGIPPRCKDQNGIYKLLANQKIGRLIKDDDEGILYIGKGDILSSNSRVEKFINYINNTENRHDGGNRYNYKKIKELKFD